MPVPMLAVAAIAATAAAAAAAMSSKPAAPKGGLPPTPQLPGADVHPTTPGPSPGRVISSSPDPALTAATNAYLAAADQGSADYTVGLAAEFAISGYNASAAQILAVANYLRSALNASAGGVLDPIPWPMPDISLIKFAFQCPSCPQQSCYVFTAASANQYAFAKDGPFTGADAAKMFGSTFVPQGTGATATVPTPGSGLPPVSPIPPATPGTNAGPPPPVTPTPGSGLPPVAAIPPQKPPIDPTKLQTPPTFPPSPGQPPGGYKPPPAPPPPALRLPSNTVANSDGTATTTTTSADYGPTTVSTKWGKGAMGWRDLEPMNPSVNFTGTTPGATVRWGAGIPLSIPSQWVKDFQSGGGGVAPGGTPPGWVNPTSPPGGFDNPPGDGGGGETPGWESAPRHH